MLGVDGAIVLVAGNVPAGKCKFVSAASPPHAVDVSFGRDFLGSYMGTKKQFINLFQFSKQSVAVPFLCRVFDRDPDRGHVSSFCDCYWEFHLD